VAHYHGIDLSQAALDLASRALEAFTCPVTFDHRGDVHRALKRVQREGYLLNDHVLSVSVSDRPKVRKRSAEEALAGLELDNL
jgi:hypothetical protein